MSSGKPDILTSGTEASGQLLDQLGLPATELGHDLHVVLRLSRETGQRLPLNQWLARSLIDHIGENGGSVTDRRDNAAIGPDLRCNLLQRAGSGVIDQSSVPSRSIEETILVAVQLRGLGHVVELLTELAAQVVPGLLVGAIEEIGLLGKPVGGVGTGLGSEVNLKAGGAEDIVGVEGLADEETGCFLAVEEGG